MAQLHVEIEEELLADLDKVAEQNDRTRSQEVRRALRIWVLRAQLLAEPEEAA
jgi:metal-responsive CopG/Arc/MetJ family transcriptional regulator